MVFVATGVLNRLFLRLSPRKPREVTEHEPSYKSISSAKHGGLRVAWTPKGRKVVLQNKQLLDVLRHLRDSYPGPESVPDKVDLSYASLEKIASRDPEKGDDTRYAVYRLRLSNGREFVLKDGIEARKGIDAHEINTAYLAKKAGLESVEHYAQAWLADSNRYFVLMESKRLPTAREYQEKYNPLKGYLLQMKLDRDAERLDDAGLSDTISTNCFVEDKGWGRFELYWFDLRKASSSPKVRNPIKSS